MSNGFFRALAKMKLVEIEGDEQPAEAKKGSTIDMAEVERILAEDEARMQQGQGKAPSRPPPRAQKQSAPSAPSAQPAPVRSPAGSGGIREDVPFDTYYAEGGVPPSAYGAEKLLRVLDGLRAMDPSTRKAAVLAMDAADDAWTIADVVLDAQRKSRSLERALAALDADLSAIRDSARAEKEKRDAYLAQAAETIRKRIAELEQTLQEETATIVAQKAQLDGQVEAAEHSAAREAARLRAEVERLAEIPAAFVIERPAGQ